MKKAITLIFASALALCLTGQPAHDQWNRQYDLLNPSPGSPDKTTKKGLDSVIAQTFNPSNSTWSNLSKEEFCYNLCGNTSKHITYGWDGNWTRQGMTEYYYNPSGQMVMMIGYYWNTISTQWTQNTKEEILRDSAGKITQVTIYSWIPAMNIWNLESKDEYHYDVFGKLNEIVGFVWSPSNIQFDYTFMVGYEYDAGGMMSTLTHYLWNESTLLFDPDSKYEYTWYSNGNPETVTSYLFDAALPGFLRQWRDEFVNDLSLNVSERTTYLWDTVNVHWYYHALEEYQYDNIYENKYLLIPCSQQEKCGWLFVHMPLSAVNYLHNGTGWNETSRKDYYFSNKVVSGIPETPGPGMQLFPNPATDRITFGFGAEYRDVTAEFYTMDGVMAAACKVQPGIPLDVSAFARGVYLCRLYLPNGTATTRVILQ